MKLPNSTHLGSKGAAAPILILFLIAIACVSIMLVSSPGKSLVSALATPKPAVKAISVTPFISKNGTKFALQGQNYQFVGINAYELATLPGVTAGCGGIIGNLDTFLEV
jgi:hypothetical protein